MALSRFRFAQTRFLVIHAVKQRACFTIGSFRARRHFRSRRAAAHQAELVDATNDVVADFGVEEHENDVEDVQEQHD